MTLRCSYDWHYRFPRNQAGTAKSRRRATGTIRRLLRRHGQTRQNHSKLRLCYNIAPNKSRLSLMFHETIVRRACNPGNWRRSLVHLVGGAVSDVVFS